MLGKGRKRNTLNGILVALALAAHFGLPYVGLYLRSGAVATLAALGVNRWLRRREAAGG